MELKTKHLMIAVISLVLLIMTLCVYAVAQDSEQMKKVEFGYPFSFIAQDFTDYNTFAFFPRYLKFEPFSRSIEKIYWSSLVASFLSFFVITELVVFVLESMSYGIRKKIHCRIACRKLKSRNKRDDA